MSFIVNLDPIKVLVKRSFLYQNKEQVGFEEGYLIAVKSQNNRPLMFTVHLESGALFSNITIDQIYCDRYFGPNLSPDPKHFYLEELQPYSCLPGDINVISYIHLKDCSVVTKANGVGVYLFTIDYLGQGLSEDPEQIKSHNIIILECGALCALPNNYCLFQDGFFTRNDSATFPPYKRNKKYPYGPA